MSKNNHQPPSIVKDKGIKLNPNFQDLKNPETIKNHVFDLMENETKATPHREILKKLQNEIQPIDFVVEAFPKAEKLLQKIDVLQKKKPLSDGEKETLKEYSKELDSLKVTQKHYLILSVENILKIAIKNDWGLCKNHDFIYLYNGTFWNELDQDTFQMFLGESSRRMGVPKFDAKYFQFRDNLFKQFLSDAILPTPETNNNKVQINLQNGTFEITQKGTNLRPFNREDFITYQLPFKYNPEATAPIFKKYLERVLPDVSSQKVLAEYMGYVFIKNGSNSLKEEKALILYGTGANGKSVFFEIVSALLGDENTSNYSLQSLTNENGYYRAKIGNKLVNYASEINTKLEADYFKKMTSGEPVEARNPYGQAFTLKQYAKLIFNANELPKDVEQTPAFFRRFLIVPFDVTIPEGEQDKNLHTKIIENELAGVFNWVLDGLNRLLEQKKFSKCDASENALQKYKLESDSVQLFLEENGYKKSAERYESFKDLYAEYRTACIGDGMRPVKKSNFKKRLENAGYIVERATQNILSVAISKGEPFKKDVLKATKSN